jgi:hypothetical protein
MPSRFSRSELEAAVDARVLLQARVLQVAFTLAPLLFFLVVTGIATAPHFGGGLSDDALTVLSMIDAGLLFVALGFGFVLLTRLVESALERAASPAQAIAAVSRISLLRLALLEGSALFGIVVVLLAGTAGRLVTRPALWWNAMPLLVLIVVSLATLPSRERLVRMAEG